MIVYRNNVPRCSRRGALHNGSSMNQKDIYSSMLDERRRVQVMVATACKATGVGHRDACKVLTAAVQDAFLMERFDELRSQLR